MGEWKENSLGKIGYTYTGLSGKKASDFGEGSPYIPYLNIFHNEILDTNSLEYVMVKKNEHQNCVKQGDAFFTTSSETPDEVGMSSVLVNNINVTYLNSFCFGYRLNDSTLFDSGFLAYLLRSSRVRKQMLIAAQGSTRHNLSKKNFNRITIKYPEGKKEQEKIAEVLSTMDIVIAKTRALIEKYKNVKTGLMQDLLTNGVDEHGNIRSPKTHEYKDSPLGRISVEWDCMSLVSCCDKISSGGTPSRKTAEFWDGNIPWITTTEIDFSHIKHATQSISEKGLRFSSANVYQVGTILIAMYGEGQTRGKTALLEIEAATNQACAALIINGKNDTDFFYYYLSSQYLRLRESSNDGSQKNLSLQILKNFQIVIPKSIEEQKQISERLQAIDRKIQSEQAYQSKLLNIKQGLMQDLLTHKVPVDALL